MESRLKVHASARFPLFEPLMWHTVANYRQKLLSNYLAVDPRAMPTAWELTGLMCVLSFLKRQMDKGDWCYCPDSIDDPEGKSSWHFRVCWLWHRRAALPVTP